MRITGGEAKGRSLDRPKGGRIRPTSGKVREALFNILGQRVCGSRFLDLCAGTGAVGIEALSRGAGGVVFVDADRRTVAGIRENLGRLALTKSANVVMSDALGYVKRQSEEPFDIVFFDPPYAMEELEEVVSLMGEGRVLVPGGLLVVEHAWKRSLPEAFGNIMLRKRYRYGDTALSCYAAVPGESSDES